MGKIRRAGTWQAPGVRREALCIPGIPRRCRPGPRSEVIRKVRAEDVVRVFLLEAVVIALTRNAQAKQIAIERLAGVGVRHCNRRVVDPEE